MSGRCDRYAPGVVSWSHSRPDELSQTGWISARGVAYVEDVGEDLSSLI